MSDRRSWTQADLADIQRALPMMSTEDIAKRYGANVRTLRAMLQRRGISVRFARKAAQPRKTCEGLSVRRSADFPPAIHGAAALEKLPDHACRWPIGDPSAEDFRFCSEPAEHYPYCPAHQKAAYV